MISSIRIIVVHVLSSGKVLPEQMIVQEPGDLQDINTAAFPHESLQYYLVSLCRLMMEIENRPNFVVNIFVYENHFELLASWQIRELCYQKKTKSIPFGMKSDDLESAAKCLVEKIKKCHFCQVAPFQCPECMQENACMPAEQIAIELTPSELLGIRR